MLTVIIGISHSILGKQLTPTTIDYLYQNRNYIINSIKEGVEGPPSAKMRRNPYFKEKLIYKYIDSPFKVWEENESQIIQEMFTIISDINSSKKIRYYLSDTVCIHFLVTVLDLPDYRRRSKIIDSLKALLKPVPQEKIKKFDIQNANMIESIANEEAKPPFDWVRDAANELVNKTYFSSITPFSKEIEDRLKNNDSKNIEFKSRILCLTDLDTMQKQIILDSVYIPWVRVRCGDLAAERILLEKFDNLKKGNNYTQLQKLSDEVALAGTYNCKKELASLFKYNIYDFRDNKECWSIHDSTIIRLGRFYPDLYGPKYDYLRMGINCICFTEMEKQYFSDLQKWAKKEFNFDFDYKGNRPYIIKDCSGEDRYSKDCKQLREKYEKYKKQNKQVLADFK